MDCQKPGYQVSGAAGRASIWFRSWRGKRDQTSLCVEGLVFFAKLVSNTCDPAIPGVVIQVLTLLYAEKPKIGSKYFSSCDRTSAIFLNTYDLLDIRQINLRILGGKQKIRRQFSWISGYRWYPEREYLPSAHLLFLPVPNDDPRSPVSPIPPETRNIIF